MRSTETADEKEERAATEKGVMARGGGAAIVTLGKIMEGLWEHRKGRTPRKIKYAGWGLI